MFLESFARPPRRLGMTHYDATQKQRFAIHDTAMGSASLKPQLRLGTTNAGLAAASNYYFSLVVCVRVRSCLCACGGVLVCASACVRMCACGRLCRDALMRPFARESFWCACIKFASTGVARLFHYPRLAGSPKRRALFPRIESSLLIVFVIFSCFVQSTCNTI